MAFDQTTRNRLARFVGDARRILTEEFTRQCKQDYGIDPDSGEVSDLARLTQLNDSQRATARILRDTIDHYVAGSPSGGSRVAIERIIREQAFTVLNRLCALRMAEARDILIQAVGKGYQSKGFQLYARVAGSALGEVGDAYRCFLFSVFDEIATDFPSLFDRFSKQGRLFPGESALLRTLEEINHPEIDPLWAADETIGWIYQYFNTEDERRNARYTAQGKPKAPQNSRELAVRNQFFTPRYVVEFLTDNTLGRLWYEMKCGESVLRDHCRYLVRRPTEIFLNSCESATESAAGSEEIVRNILSQEDLLREAVHVAHRPLKDPREIRMLDPACGSMHFGLYAFDLFTSIYDEAWEIARGDDVVAASASTFAPFVKFAAGFSDKVAFLREVPRLIIEHNIHGIDIDPRAVQIAGLSLWLRAQRAWHDAGVKPPDRPRITRSNIVCAEPMPGETQLLGEFIQRQFPAGERAVFGYLLEKVFNCMKLAGEAGSALRVEMEVRTAIVDAKSLWQQVPRHEQALLFGTQSEMSAPRQIRLDIYGITDDQFWSQAEQRIYDALQAYAEHAENGGGFQRRLFADDAAQGFAFIDLCRKHHDVIVMNPPFGEWSSAFNAEAKTSYPVSYHDIMTAFVDRGSQLLNTGGLLGAITSRTCFFLGSFSSWRKEVILSRLSPTLMADLGHGVMDAAMVEAAAYIAVKPVIADRARLVCFRLVRESDPSSGLLQATAQLNGGQLAASVSLLDPNEFQSIPNAPFAYWATEKIRRLYSKYPSFENRTRIVRQGGVTGNDERYLRLSSEIAPAERLGKSVWWAPFAKGGKVSDFFSDIPALIKWDSNRSTFFGYTGLKHRPSEKPSSADFYFQAGLTWPLRATRFAPVPLPRGSIFSIRGYAILAPVSQLVPLLALGNSSIFDYLFKLSLGESGRPEYIVGILKLLPVPELSSSVSERLSCIAMKGWVLKFSEYRSRLTSSVFCTPALKLVSDSLAGSIKVCLEQFENREREIAQCRTEIDNIVGETYGLDEDDLESIKSFHGSSTADDSVEDEEDSDDVLDADDANLISTLLDYAFGVRFGRWDIRFATGERLPPPLPDPFAPLPICPPGMFQDDDGLPISPAAGRRLRKDGYYPLDVVWDGILVDDPDHPLNLERGIHAVLAILWGDRVDELEHEACGLLSVPSLNEWFRRPAGFFADHLRRFSKSPRQAPIYWPLSTASGTYTLWVYYHRLTDQTLFTAVNDFVDSKLLEVSKETSRLRSKANRSSEDEIALVEAADLEIELREFRDELLRIGKFWKPNLNDGVQITAAPLWKLFQLKPWQKKLKETWQALQAGEYDWAHLAYSIWPDRVREKCKTDKSLAIAHGLEALYIEPPATAKKSRKKKPKVDEEQLIEDAD
ncbi:MAG: hypothetical protein JWN40_3817 [Phycisphaerales bacterium]|nr:hypothetical protein [Phycisphaerales bacterium]